MAKISIQVNLVPSPIETWRRQHSPELALLKLLPLTYHHSHFLAATLAATLDFTSFFTMAFFRAEHFLQLDCFGIDSLFTLRISHVQLLIVKCYCLQNALDTF